MGGRRGHPVGARPPAPRLLDRRQGHRDPRLRERHQRPRRRCARHRDAGPVDDGPRRQGDVGQHRRPRPGRHAGPRRPARRRRVEPQLPGATLTDDRRADQRELGDPQRRRDRCRPPGRRDGRGPDRPLPRRPAATDPRDRAALHPGDPTGHLLPQGPGLHRPGQLAQARLSGGRGRQLTHRHRRRRRTTLHVRGHQRPARRHPRAGRQRGRRPPHPLPRPGRRRRVLPAGLLLRPPHDARPRHRRLVTVRFGLVRLGLRRDLRRLVREPRTRPHLRPPAPRILRRVR